MFEFDFDPNLQIKTIDLNQFGNDLNINIKKNKKQIENVEFDLYHLYYFVQYL